MAKGQYLPKRTRAGQRDPLKVFVTDTIGPTGLSDLRLWEANTFSKAAHSVIRSIHGVPSLFHDVDLARIEIYVGRSSEGYDGKHLYTEIRSAKKRYGHDFAIPVARVPSKKVEIFEACKISLLSFLHEHDRLCVGAIANQRETPIGQKPSTDESIIYLTFKVLGVDRADLQRPSEKELQLAADLLELRNENREIPTRRQILEGIGLIRVRTEKENLCWSEESIDFFKERDSL